MERKQVPVIGEAGLIGSNLTNYLTGPNDVIALDNSYLDTEENPNDAMEFVNTNVIDDQHESGPQPSLQSNILLDPHVKYLSGNNHLIIHG